MSELPVTAMHSVFGHVGKLNNRQHGQCLYKLPAIRAGATSASASVSASSASVQCRAFQRRRTGRESI